MRGKREDKMAQQESAPENRTPDKNHRLELGLFLFNAVAITLLAALFGLEAFGKGARGINDQFAYMYMAALGTYVFMKRAGRWGNNAKENRWMGEWIAVAFLIYVQIVLKTLYFFFGNMQWPPMLNMVTYEVLGLLAVNETVKAIDKRCNKNGG